MNSIISNEKKCYFCGSSHWLECHHIFGGANRNKSTRFGLVVYLCHFCHNEPPNGVHHNRQRMDYLRQIGQRAFMERYPNEDFLKLFGRNYL